MRITLIFVGILLLGSLLYAGCTNGGTPGGGLDFFSSGDAGQGGVTPTPTPTPTGGQGEEIVLAEGRSNTYDLVIDGAYIYWTEKSGSAEGGVYRTLIDGTGPVETVATGYPQAFSLCIVGTDLYFTERVATTGRIVRVDLSTGLPFVAEDYITGLIQPPQWIRHANGFLYWTGYFQTGSFYRVLAGLNAPSLADVQTVINGTLLFPFAFTLDAVNNQAAIAEIGGTDGSSIWTCPLAQNQVPPELVKVYSGPEVAFVTSLKWDTANNFLYWCNFQSNSGVFRIDEIDGTPEVVETGVGRAFDCFGPAAGAIYYSVNEQRQNDGNIFFDLINTLTGLSLTDFPEDTTITSPLRFEIQGGSYYWTEYFGFDPLDINAGGSQQSRVMRYNPVP